MSIVVGIKHNGVVWMACDSQITEGQLKHSLSSKQHKVFAVQDRPGVLLGCCGPVRGLNLLEANNMYIDELSYLKDEIDYRYMVNVFPILVNKLFVDNGYISAEEPELQLRNSIVVSIEDEIYDIGPDGAVMVVEKFVAIGSGSELAYGSLESQWEAYKHFDSTTLTDDDIMDMLGAAVSAAYRNVGCSGEIYVVNSLGKEFQLVI